jgi:hypothetical protein
VTEVKKAWFNLLLVCFGLSLSLTAQAQLRVKPYVQTGNIGINEYKGEGIDLTWMHNPEAGLFFMAAVNQGKGRKTSGTTVDRKFVTNEISIGKSLDNGITLFAGITSNDLKFSRPSYEWDLGIGGLFAGIGYSLPLAGGALSLSGSIMSGDIDGTYTCRTGCFGLGVYTFNSEVSGSAVSIAYAYPISNTVTIGIESKTRSYDFDYFGSTDTIDFELNRIFVEVAF